VKKSTTPAASGETKQPLTVKLAAEDFGKEWVANSAGTARKYTGYLVEVTGTIDGVGLDPSNKPIVLVPCGTGTDGQRLLLHLRTKHQEPWALCAPGQPVTARGKLKDAGFGIPYLNDAEFTSLGPNPSVAVKATELVAEAARDADAASTRYKGKAVVVSGKVVRRSEDRKTVFLDGGDGKVVECKTYLVLDIPPLGTPLEEGKDAQLYGFVASTQASGDDVQVSLRDCLPILGKK
jgi:hypothetical protein